MATVRTRDPELRARRRLRETGRAYVQFALAEPGLFEVAFAQEWPADATGAPDIATRTPAPTRCSTRCSTSWSRPAA